MASTLSFLQFVGGDDNLQIESAFPSDQKTVLYNFNQDITGWTFKMDYQTVVVDTLAYDRDNNPNFANSQVIGFFPQGVADTSTFVSVVSASSGTVKVTLPGDIYNEGILPNARTKVPITVIGVSWTDNNTPKQTETHRWALVQSWEPGVNPVDPTTSTNFTALGA